MYEIEPHYLDLYKSGELKKRAAELTERLQSCDLCPRYCKVNRLKGKKGYCHSAELPIVSSYCAHHGEEPPISGSRGSGTIFFGNCNMRCAYCQNYQISQAWREQLNNEVSVSMLSNHMLYLQNELQCHNINLVTPSHFVPQITLALLQAIPKGLHLPLVYNTSGYDSLDTIKLLNGIIDIYLPDLRYADNKWSNKYSRAPDYVERARAAIKEMYHQVGNPFFNHEGIVQRGLIVRHLILPEHIAGSAESLTWLLNEVSPEITISIMSQYYPTYKVLQMPILARRITQEEYAEVVELLRKLNIENGWMQETDAAEYYLPDFARNGHPFEKRK